MEELCASIDDKEMQIVLQGEGDTLITVCKLQSEVISIFHAETEEELMDVLEDEIDPEDLPEERVLLLLPCTCQEEFEEGEINSRPELN